MAAEYVKTGATGKGGSGWSRAPVALLGQIPVLMESNG
jgi:hypothetical protein